MDENLSQGQTPQPTPPPQPESSSSSFASTPSPSTPPPHVPPQSTPPPPVTPPPVVVATASGPAPRKGGSGWKWLALLLLLALGASVLMNLKHFGSKVAGKSFSKSGVRHKRQYLEEVTVEDNGSGNKIAVINIEGVISSGDSRRHGDNMVDFVREQFKAAQEDNNVKAVILKVNSPGGEVLASDEIYNTIVDFQKGKSGYKGKPVVASMQTLAASGGYYVSAPCSWIVANDMTITGSIGVIMHGFNVSGLMDKIGVTSETYKSGKFKDMLSPFRRHEEKPKGEDAMVQDMIMETYGTFTNIVYTGRSEAAKKNRGKGRELADDWANFADGRVLSGREAYRLGFVDENGDFETAVDRTMAIASINNADLIEYQQPFDLGDLFGIFGQSEAKTVKVDLGLDFPKLQSGCLYFIYPQAIP